MKKKIYYQSISKLFEYIISQEIKLQDCVSFKKRNLAVLYKVIIQEISYCCGNP